MKTKEQILEAVRNKELTPTQAIQLLQKIERKLLTFKVAQKTGWASVYWNSMRYPTTLPSKLWLELLDTENLENFKKFLKDNEKLFKNKE